MHHAYGSIGGLSERIARRIDGDVPQSPEWHQELLHAMGLSVDGVRPCLFGQGSVAALRELLAFRHFFRHAYAIELDPERLQALRGRILQAAPKILDEIDAFDAFLAAVARCDD